MPSSGDKRVHPMMILTVVVPEKKGVEALDWYKSALSAKDDTCYKNEDGTIMYATLDSLYGFKIAVDEHTPKEHMAVPISSDQPPKEATASYMYINLPDGTSTDTAVDNMRKNGAIVTHEPKDMFYGHRVGRVVDKYAIGWAFAQKCAFDKNAPMPKKYGH